MTMDINGRGRKYDDYMSVFCLLFALFYLSIEILLMANRSTHNDTEDEEDNDKRESMMREAQAMLRGMRYRSCAGQKKLADKEKVEAETCKFQR